MPTYKVSVKKLLDSGSTITTTGLHRDMSSPEEVAAKEIEELDGSMFPPESATIKVSLADIEKDYDQLRSGIGIQDNDGEYETEWTKS